MHPEGMTVPNCNNFIIQRPQTLTPLADGGHVALEEEGVCDCCPHAYWTCVGVLSGARGCQLSQVVGSWSSEGMFGDLRNLGVFTQQGKAKRG